MKESIETSSIEEQLNEQFSLEHLDDWQTTAALAQSAITMAESGIAGAEIHLFVHSSEAREYREINREGISSFPEDSLFIACLSMRDEGIGAAELFSEYKLDEALLEELLETTYSGSWIHPIVHRFRLLAFVLVSFPSQKRDVTAAEKDLIKSIAARLRTNLYAASVADERQRSLLRLAEYPQTLREKHTAQELIDQILVDLGKEIPFENGVYYEYDEYRRVLEPRTWRGLSTKPPALAAARGISGLTLERRRAVSVSSRQKHPAYEVIAEEDFFQGSFVSAPIQTDKRIFGVVTLGRKADGKNDYGVEQRYTLEIASAFIAAELDSRHIYDELEKSYFSTISSLTRALEAKDPYTRGHSQRVMEYSVAIAHELKLSPDAVRRIRYAAILHDIGKIGISDLIITKPDRLTDREYDEIKRHTEIGYEIIDSNGFLAEIRDLIRYHHEKMDGTGYYAKSIGDYPWEAMIISLADIFDALDSDRPYRAALGDEEALKVLMTLVDVHFDQRILNAFTNFLHKRAKAPGREEGPEEETQGQTSGDRRTGDIRVL